jgi:hypothetical protein
MFQLLRLPFICDVRSRLQGFDVWQICLFFLFFTSLGFYSVLPSQNSQVLFCLVQQACGFDMGVRLQTVHHWAIGVFVLFITSIDLHSFVS